MAALFLRILPLAALICTLALPAQAALFVIVHGQTQESQISRQELRQMYLNQQPKWPSGQRVHLAILAKGPGRDRFLRAYIGKNSARFDRHWKRQLFTGKGIPPESFASQQELLDYVRSTPGSIACVEMEQSPEKVKVLEVVD